jgi:hypothetical protein
VVSTQNYSTAARGTYLEEMNKMGYVVGMKRLINFETSTVVIFQDEVFWVVTPCRVVVGYQRFRGSCCLLFQCEVEDGGRKIFRNDGIVPRYYTTSQRIRPLPETSYYGNLVKKYLAFLEPKVHCLVSKFSRYKIICNTPFYAAYQSFCALKCCQAKKQALG